MNNLLLLLSAFTISCLLTSCFPILVREHQVEPSPENSNFQIHKSRCDGFWTNLGSTLYLSEDMTANLHSLKNPRRLELKVWFKGKPNERFHLERNSIRYKYSGEDWTEIKVKLYSTEFSPLGGLPDLIRAQDSSKDFIFLEDTPYLMIHLYLTAEIPFQKSDIEVETPQISVGQRKVAPSVLHYKWNSRITIAPLNGC